MICRLSDGHEMDVTLSVVWQMDAAIANGWIYDGGERNAEMCTYIQIRSVCLSLVVCRYVMGDGASVSGCNMIRLRHGSDATGAVLVWQCNRLQTLQR